MEPRYLYQLLGRAQHSSNDQAAERANAHHSCRPAPMWRHSRPPPLVRSSSRVERLVRVCRPSRCSSEATVGGVDTHPLPPLPQAGPVRRRRTPGEHEVGQRTQGEDIEPHPVRAVVPDPLGRLERLRLGSVDIPGGGLECLHMGAGLHEWCALARSAA